MSGGWKLCKVGEIANVLRGASPRPKGDPRYYGGNVPRLMVADVTRDGKYVTPQIDFLTEEGAKLSRPMPAGTLTIVCSGTVGIPSILAVDACIHDGFLAINQVSKDCNIEFLYYTFSSLRQKFEASATHGGVFTNLTTEILREFEFKLPSLQEQQETVEILTTWDEAIALTERAIKAKQKRRRMLLEALTQGKPDWKQFQLRDLIEVVHGYAFSSEYFSKRQIGKVLLTPGNFNEEGGFRWLGEKQRYYDGEIPERYLLKKNDLLVVMTEQASGLLGSSLLVPDDNTFLHNQRLGLVVINNEGCLSREYLYHYFNTSSFRKYVSSTASGTKVKHTSPSKICSADISIPSISEQRRIAEILNLCDEEVTKLVTLKLLYQQQKQGLMQKLLTGKWCVAVQEAA